MVGEGGHKITKNPSILLYLTAIFRSIQNGEKKIYHVGGPGIMPSNAVAQNDKFLGSLYGQIFAIFCDFVWIRNGLCQILAGLSGRSQRPI